MSSRTITFRFSEEVIKIIEAQAQATGSNRTAVVLKALTACYGVAPPASTSAIDRLQQQVHQLASQLSQLSEQVANLQQSGAGYHSLFAATAHPVTNLPSTNPSIAAADLSTELSIDLLPIREIVHENLIQPQTAECSTPDPQHDLLAQLTYQTGLLDQILSASSDMILILDRRLRFTYTNSVTRRVLKVERHFFLGKTLQEIDYFFLGDFASNCEQVFANGQTIYAEFTISATHENKVFEYSLNPIYGINHEIDAVICVAKDITRQRQNTLALQVAEQNYHNVFELANDSIFVAELATQRIFNVNQKASRRLGYTRQELLQLTMNDVMMPLADDRREEILHELQTTGSVVFEHQQRHKTGKGVPAEFSCHMVEYEGKLAVQSFVRDITEQKRIEAQLRHLEVTLAKAMNTAANPIDDDTSEQSTDIQCSCGEDE